jgi:hypothetical protein
MAADLNGFPQAFGSGKLVDWRVDATLGLAPNSSFDAAKPLDLVPELVRDSATSAVLAFGDIANFQIDFAKRLVSLVSKHSAADPATINHFLNDHVAPRIIAHCGALVLHGSAITIAGRLAIFMGRTGAGKSTLAASLLKRGHKLLGDDAVIISKTEAGWVGEAVYPSLRLFPESIHEVFPETVDTSAMAFYSDKRLVRADEMQSAGSLVVPLGMIFVLTDGEHGVKSEVFGPADACMVMLENSFALDPKSPVAAADRMARAAALAAAVPCHELSYPYNFAILGEVCERVTTLMDALEPPALQDSLNPDRSP